MWEFTRNDSIGAMVLAVFFLLSMIGILGWASFKVIRIAKRSVSLHKNPAYILYSDPAALNRWGFLYVQFRASAYYFVVPLLLYTFVKAMFIAFGQKAGTVQAFALFFIELIYLVAVCMMRPWMDKRTNIFNISICVINFLNVIFLLVFTRVGNPPVCLNPLDVLCRLLTFFTGYCPWCDGRDFLHHERSLLTRPPHSCPRRLDLRARLEESRCSLPANAGRPGFVHQVQRADDAIHGT
jgi:flagellar biosynthesis protein FliQ